jgi:hypothetical protein
MFKYRLNLTYINIQIQTEDSVFTIKSARYMKVTVTPAGKIAEKAPSIVKHVDQTIYHLRLYHIRLNAHLLERFGQGRERHVISYHIISHNIT